eukprot:jgi/Tetstr1/433191/TSEL_002374.t1
MTGEVIGDPRPSRRRSLGASWFLFTAALRVLQVAVPEAAARPESLGRRLLSAEDGYTWNGVLPRTGLQVLRPVPVGTHYAFVHIPKAAGASFQKDCANWMPVGVTVKGNREALLTDTAIRYPATPMVALFRHPWRHILSQFMECEFSPWGKSVTAAHPRWREIVPPHVGSIGHSSPYVGFYRWLQYFQEPHSDTAEFADPKAFAFDCYNPWNLQARYMTAVDSKAGRRTLEGRYAHAVWDKSEKRPPLASAIEAAKQLSFLGISDLYQPSLCLFQFHTTGALPHECGCGAEPAGQLHPSNVTHDNHGVPPHSLDDLPLRVLRNIGRLVEIDARLYLAALDMFELRAREAATATGVDVLCQGQAAELRDEVRALLALSRRRGAARAETAEVLPSGEL